MFDQCGHTVLLDECDRWQHAYELTDITVNLLWVFFLLTTLQHKKMSEAALSLSEL